MMMKTPVQPVQCLAIPVVLTAIVVPVAAVRGNPLIAFVSRYSVADFSVIQTGKEQIPMALYAEK
jgi:hypothetical protein